jgi:hypothetical protein
MQRPLFHASALMYTDSKFGALSAARNSFDVEHTTASIFLFEKASRMDAACLRPPSNTNTFTFPPLKSIFFANAPPQAAGWPPLRRCCYGIDTAPEHRAPP